MSKSLADDKWLIVAQNFVAVITLVVQDPLHILRESRAIIGDGDMLPDPGTGWDILAQVKMGAGLTRPLLSVFEDVLIAFAERYLEE